MEGNSGPPPLVCMGRATIACLRAWPVLSLLSSTVLLAEVVHVRILCRHCRRALSGAARGYVAN